MKKQIQVKNVGELNDYFKSVAKLILIIGNHEWVNEKTQFVCMVRKDGTIPKDTDTTGVDFLMRVKTRFGTELDLKQENCFVVTETHIVNPKNN